jgi:hypothetical protein
VGRCRCGGGANLSWAERPTLHFVPMSSFGREHNYAWRLVFKPDLAAQLLLVDFIDDSLQLSKSTKY